MQILIFFSPQLVLFLTAALVFAADLVGSKEKKWLSTLALLGSLVSLALGLYLLAGVNLEPAVVLGGMLAVDSFSLYFQVFAAVVIGLILVISREYLEGRTPYPAEFYSFLLLAGVAISLLAASADLVMLFIAFEMLSITSYILTGYLRDDRRSSEGAMKYFLYGAMASAVMLYGMSLLYGAAGSTNLNVIADSLGGGGASERWLIYPAFVLLMAGFGYKIAAVPFHQWSPDAYEGAPTPVTAFLSVGSVAAGFGVLIRVLVSAFPEFQTEWIGILAAMAMMTMTLGNLVAISQQNIKRMLAYSGIAHAGYMLIGLVSWDLSQTGSSFDGVSGVLVYLLVYLFANLGAFAVVIALEQAENTNQIKDFRGLMGKSPILAGTMAVFLLSLTGIPATGGFIGKLLVFGAALQQDFYLLALVAIINSVIAGFYYLNVIRYMFFQEADAAKKQEIQLSGMLKSAVILACVFTLLIGLFAQPFLRFVGNSLHFITG